MAIVASDPEIQSNVQFPQSAAGNALVVRTGGQITLETGAALNVGGVAVGSQLNGIAVEGGTIAVVGSVAVVTGLTAVKSVNVENVGSVAPALTAVDFSYVITSGGTIELYAWMPTSSTNPTLIANTATVNVGWTAVGTI